MPRKARIDAPGALQHIIIRGIERKKIYRDAKDKNVFLKRFGKVVLESSTACYAWALMDNHAHLLLRTGATPVATVMRRVLTDFKGHSIIPPVNDFILKFRTPEMVSDQRQLR